MRGRRSLRGGRGDVSLNVRGAIENVPGCGGGCRGAVLVGQCLGGGGHSDGHECDDAEHAAREPRRRQPSNPVFSYGRRGQHHRGGDRGCRCGRCWQMMIIRVCAGRFFSEGEQSGGGNEGVVSRVIGLLLSGACFTSGAEHAVLYHDRRAGRVAVV